MVCNSIQKINIVHVDSERAFSAFTSREGLQKWFVRDIEGEISPGQPFAFIWSGMKSNAVCVSLRPNEFFSFRWIPGSGYHSAPYEEHLSTLVEVEFRSHPDGTEVILTETGFSELEPSYQESAFHDNDTGWDEELAHYVKYLNEDRLKNE